MGSFEKIKITLFKQLFILSSLVAGLIAIQWPAFAFGKEIAQEGEDPGTQSAFNAESITSFEEDQADSQTFESDSCPEIFGDEETVRQNRERREQLFVRLRRVGEDYVVVHRATAWRAPEHARIKGMQLDDIRIESEKRREAVVYLPEDIARRYGCESGRYKVAAGDGLFDRAVILAVRQDLLLVEYDDMLAYLTMNPNERVDFRMVWQSFWTMPHPVEPPTKKPQKPRQPPNRRNRRR